MTKTLTIRDEICRKLISVKRENESFSELFERLVKGQSPMEILKSIRGKIDLDKESKRKLLLELKRQREEHRT
ncbi:MAG: antitoxin VapB family protein [Nitrososphaerales archaeon]